MIASSPCAKALCLFLSLLFTGAALRAMVPDVALQMRGAGESAGVRIGVSFADLQAGTLSASETRAVAKVIEPRMPVSEPVAREALRPEAAEPLVTQADPAPSVSPLAATHLVPVAAVEALPDAENADTSPPRARPEGLARLPDPQHAPVRKTSRGNSPVSLAAGSSASVSARDTTRQGAGEARAETSGTAARDNYRGVVQRQIFGRPLRGGFEPGRVLVEFTLAADGRLASLSVNHSSGSAALDAAALAHVRAAEPFPPPPPGALRRVIIPFTVN